MPLFFVRTAYDPDARQTVKIDTPVNLPERFNFTNFAVDITVRGPDYRIKMFIVHSNGHYVSYVRDRENDWKLIDDDVVSSVSASEALEAAQKSSLCFYESI